MLISDSGLLFVDTLQSTVQGDHKGMHSARVCRNVSPDSSVVKTEKSKNISRI